MKIPLLLSLAALCALAVVGTRVTHLAAYLGNDATACTNCHVMGRAYESWYHAGHRTLATCNDCHVPHDLVPAYLAKTQSGISHVGTFVLGTIPDAIRVTETSRRTIQANCIRCHQESVSQIAAARLTAQPACFDCHRSVAHGDRGDVLNP